MGKKTHGPYLIAAIELNDISKVSDILSTKFRDRQNVKHFLVSEVRRLATEYTAVPLLLAASLADPTIIRYFVQKHDVNINHVHESGFSKPRKRQVALHVAVRRSLHATVEAILALNADPNIQDHKGRTALHHAVKRADFRTCKLLVSRGAQVGNVDVVGNSPLHLATIYGHMELVRLLVQYGGDLYKKGQLGAIPIHIAAKEGHAALVRMFCELYEVSADIKVQCYDERELAPLHVAAMEGHAATVLALMEACGADVNLKDSLGETALHNTVIHMHDPLGMKSKDDFTETVKVLLNCGAEVNARNARGETALHLAARNEFEKIIEVLLLAGCDPLIEDNDGSKAIDLVSDVSHSTLKNAISNREKLLSESMEVRAKGFSTSLQRVLPFTSRSQSTMNMPMAGVYPGGPRYGSSMALYQHNHSLVTTSNTTGVNRSHDSRTSSSSSSKQRSKDLMWHPMGAQGSGAGVWPIPRGGANYSDVMNESLMLPPKPLAAMRKTKSVEDLDQQSERARGGVYSGHKHGSQPSVRAAARGRKSSHRAGSETSSVWKITPPGSVSELNAERGGGRQRGRGGSDEESEYSRVQAVSKNKQRGVRESAGTDVWSDDESEEYYLDDDDSVDILELEYEVSRGQGQRGTGHRGQGYRGQDEGRPVKNKDGLQTWLDEQARLVKSKEKSKPVAQSTPPASHKQAGNHGNRSAIHDDSSASVTSSESEVEEETRQRSAVGRPQAAARPAVAASSKKPKPAPPPKPGKEKPGKITEYFTENPHIDRVIELEVSDGVRLGGETSIKVHSVHPPGPAKVQTIPAGASSSTFVRIPGTKPIAKPVSAGESRPVPKPRETKTSYREGHRDGSRNAIGRADSQSEESSGSFSSGEEEVEEWKRVPPSPPRNPPPKVKPTARKGQSSEKKISVSSSGVSKTDDDLGKSKPVTGLVFQKADAEPSGNAFQRLHPMRKSFGDTLSSPKPGKSEAELLSTSFQLDSSTKSNGVTTRKPPPAVTSPVELKAEKNSVISGKGIQPATRSPQKSGHTARAEESEESEPEEESDDDDNDTVSAAIRTVTYKTENELGFMIVGGNAEGIYAFAVDGSSPASREGGLRAGDQLLLVNSRRVHGKTKEEALDMLRLPSGQSVSLTVRQAGQVTKSIANRGGSGDSFTVRAHFTLDTMRKGELSVKPGELYHVTDSSPEGHAGFWVAYRLEGAKPAAECVSGLIPNKVKADQLALKQNLSSDKPNDQRSNAFFRSFRRAKSADRGRNLRSVGDEEDSTASDVAVGWERVTQIRSNPRKPAVVLGLFCDKVIGMLVRDSPDLFEDLGDSVERKNSEAPVDVEALRNVMRKGKHPLIVLVPPSIDYLLHHTDLNPIVIYLSPVSKVVVKAVKASIAPNYNKNAGYMYEEAVKFERAYSSLFTTVIDYTTDDWWFFNVKEAIKRIQSEPAWRSERESEREATANRELQRIIPSWGNTLGKSEAGDMRRDEERKGRDKTVRISRTTDDIPENNRSPRSKAGELGNKSGSGSSLAGSEVKKSQTNSASTQAEAANNHKIRTKKTDENSMIVTSHSSTINTSPLNISSQSASSDKGKTQSASRTTVAPNKMSVFQPPPASRHASSSSTLNVQSRETPL